MLGETQEGWLYDGFKTTRHLWTLLAQQVPMMRIDVAPDPGRSVLSMDMWDGATAARDRLFGAIEDSKTGNVIVLSGDIHSNWAGELKKDFFDERSAALGVEFIGTSITSNGDGHDIRDNDRKRMAKQPYVKFFNNQRGYACHIVTPARWKVDFRVLDKVTVAGGRISTRMSLVVENGKSAIAQA
jgi:alkaline phosphatase D